MSTRKKKSKGRVKSKAAQARDQQKHGQSNGKNEGIQRPRRGGLITKMRGGFQGAVGGGDGGKEKSIANQILWFVVLAAAVFFFARGF